MDKVSVGLHATLSTKRNQGNILQELNNYRIGVYNMA